MPAEGLDAEPGLATAAFCLCRCLTLGVIVPGQLKCYHGRLAGTAVVVQGRAELLPWVVLCRALQDMAAARCWQHQPGSTCQRASEGNTCRGSEA